MSNWSDKNFFDKFVAAIGAPFSDESTSKEKTIWGTMLVLGVIGGCSISRMRQKAGNDAFFELGPIAVG